MDDQIDQLVALRDASARLLSQVEEQLAAVECRRETLEALIREAETAEKRRAARNVRDGKVYALGAGFEPVDALDLDPVAITGFLSLKGDGLLLLVRLALQHPDEQIAVLLARLFRSSAGQAVRAHGVWVRWSWLKALYDAECEYYHTLFAGNGRRLAKAEQPTTRRQRYLVDQLCLYLQVARPNLADRGAAYEWIKEHGGKPRFQQEPPRPSLSGLAEVFA